LRPNLQAYTNIPTSSTVRLKTRLLAFLRRSLSLCVIACCRDTGALKPYRKKQFAFWLQKLRDHDDVASTIRAAAAVVDALGRLGSFLRGSFGIFLRGGPIAPIASENALHSRLVGSCGNHLFFQARGGLVGAGACEPQRPDGQSALSNGSALVRTRRL
jgi:hypothetical protein